MNGKTVTLIASVTLIIGLIIGYFINNSSTNKTEFVKDVAYTSELKVSRVTVFYKKQQSSETYKKKTTIIKPSGEQIIVETEDSKNSSSEEFNSDSKTEDKKESFSSSEQFKQTKSTENNWIIGASVGLNLSEPEPVYGVTVQRRILGPIFLGASISSEKTVGLNASVTF